MLASDDVAVTNEQLRLRMRSLVVPLCGELIQSADRIIATTDDPAVKREALRWKIDAVPVLREALFRPNPFVAITDAWVLSWQMRDYFESERGRLALGDAAPAAAATCQQMEGEINEIAASLVKSGDVSRVRVFARQWAKDHPIRYSIASRESTVSRATERDVLEEFSALELAGATAVTVDDLVRRLDIYSAQLFDQARWQVELTTGELASDYKLDEAIPLAEQALQTARDAVAILTRLEPDINDALAAAGTAPEIIGSEREALQKFVTAERRATLEYITKEREATLIQVAKEREALQAQVSTERAIVLDHISREREAVLGDVRRSIETERKAILDSVEELAHDLIDQAVLSAASIVGTSLVSIFFGIILLLFITRRVFRIRP